MSTDFIYLFMRNDQVC